MTDTSTISLPTDHAQRAVVLPAGGHRVDV